MNHGRRRDHRWPPVWWRAQYVAMTQTREYQQGKALSIRHQRRQGAEPKSEPAVPAK